MNHVWNYNIVKGVYKCIYQSLHDLFRGVQFRNICQEGHGDRPQGLGGPLAEPVDSTAVDEGRELTKSGSENLSQRAENGILF